MQTTTQTLNRHMLFAMAFLKILGFRFIVDKETLKFKLPAKILTALISLAI